MSNTYLRPETQVNRSWVFEIRLAIYTLTVKLMHSGNCNMFQGRRKHYSRCFQILYDFVGMNLCERPSSFGIGKAVEVEFELRLKAQVRIGCTGLHDVSKHTYCCSNWCKREETAWQSVSSQEYPKNEICFATWHSDVVIAGSDCVFSNVPHCCLIN